VSTAMSLLAGLASDLAAIVLLAYGVYFRRYHRRDLLLAYVALNVGVLAVTVLFTGAQAGPRLARPRRVGGACALPGRRPDTHQPAGAGVPRRPAP
jgi:hypothetical protein